VPEAVYCAGKTPEQVVAIVERLAEHHDNVLATRAEPAVTAALVASGLPCRVHEAARLVVVKPTPSRAVGFTTTRRAGRGGAHRGGERGHLRSPGG
jgi:NCAIR mutase (PurE)-related protein